MLVISAHIAIIFKTENFQGERSGLASVCGFAAGSRAVSSRKGAPRQAGTWDPLLQSLHLGEPLLQQQHRETAKGLSNCVRDSWEILDKKDTKRPKNPTATSEAQGAKED